MKIDISDITKTDGASLEFDFSEKLDELTEYSDIELDAPISFNGQLTNTGGVLKLKGTLETHFTGRCHKCLKDVGGDLDLKVSENIVGSESSNDTEAYTYEGKFVDLTRIVKDNIILSLPMKLLCEQTCKGMCPVCGTDRNLKDCSCSQENINPQMEVLKNFFSN